MRPMGTYETICTSESPRFSMKPLSIAPSIAEGHSALIRMPKRAFSKAAVLVSPMTACLLALFRELSGMPVSPAREDSLTIAPPPASFMRRISCLREKKTPFTLVSSERSLLVSVCSTKGAIASNPALLKAQSMRPCSDAVRSTRAWTSASMRTSAHKGRFSAGLAGETRRLFAPLLVSAAKDHVCALAREGDGSRSSDAAGSTCHEHHFFGERVHAASLSRSSLRLFDIMPRIAGRRSAGSEPGRAVVATDPASANADCDNGGRGVPCRGTLRPDAGRPGALAARARVACEEAPARANYYRLQVGPRTLGQRRD